MLTNKTANKIPRTEIEFSVNSGRTSLSDEKIGMVKHCKLEEDREEERRYQSEKRTRSPRKRTTHTEPWKRPPTNRCDIDIREVQDDRRPRDIRLREEQEREHSQEGIRGPRTSDTRDRDRYRRASEPREPRSYTRRPRSEDRQNKERPRRRD